MATTDEWNITKFKNLGTKKEAQIKVTNYKVGCFAAYTSDRELTFRLYKERKKIRVGPLNSGLMKQMDDSHKMVTICK